MTKDTERINGDSQIPEISVVEEKVCIKYKRGDFLGNQYIHTEYLSKEAFDILVKAGVLNPQLNNNS